MSKTYKVTEEFLQEAYKEACSEWKQKLETEFPEVFIKFEIGKWYKEEGSNLLFYIETTTPRVATGYGFDRYGKWFSNYDWKNIPLRKCIKLATEEEVENALFIEAEKRYGKNWKEVKLKETAKIGLPPSNSGGLSVCFSLVGKTFWNKNGILFRDGVWAEVLEDKCSEKEELLQQLKQLQEKIEKLC